MEILQYPDPVLRKISLPVDTKPDKQLIAAMSEYRGKCAGLSAIQLGFPVRVIMVKSGTFYMFMVNPEIVKVDEKMSEYEEGCMSIDRGVTRYTFMRPRRVKVKYLDMDMLPHSIKGDGLFARILQHEIDHLDGKLIIDYISD